MAKTKLDKYKEFEEKYNNTLIEYNKAVAENRTEDASELEFDLKDYLEGMRQNADTEAKQSKVGKFFNNLKDKIFMSPAEVEAYTRKDIASGKYDAPIKRGMKTAKEMTKTAEGIEGIVDTVTGTSTNYVPEAANIYSKKQMASNLEDLKTPTEETPVSEIEETIETPTEEVPGTVDNMATEETPAPTETKTPERKTFDWRRSAKDLSRYGGALYDSITAMHKRKANQAVALSGFGGAYGSTQKPFTEEETIAPLSNIRKQAYENYISNMQATQDALNNVTRTDIKNKYKSVYDIDAANTTDRQAYATQVIGAIQNKLNIDLNRDIMSMKKEELQSYLEEIKSDFETLKNEIKDKGLKDALSTALPMFIQILNKGSLEQALLQANINTVGNATTSIGNLLGQLALNGLK